jgi:anti-sigma factor RsiW
VEKNMTDRHEHLDEGTIHAWLDGELPPDESARVESLTAACTECAALVAEARGLVAASSRVLSSLDAVPGGVIPGVARGSDQLAALRARRRETSRRWWNDRRILAAASLLFVAGISTVMWRSSPDDAKLPSSVRVAETAPAVTDSARPPATAPANAPSEATARDARVAAAPVPVPAPPRQMRAADSVVAPKAAAADAESRRLNVAANESRRADSTSVAAKSQLVDSVGAQRAPQRPVAEVQRQQGATQGQQALRQRAEQSRAAAPPAAFGAGARLGSVVTTGVAADMAASLRVCYQLRELRGDPGIIADSVRLLNETPMELSDPTWYRARAVGWADTALVWRSVDSTTVELRSRVAARPMVVRFRTTPTGLPLPEGGREPGVRLAIATRLPCP